MATYYIGADAHSNSTKPAVEQRGRIVARYFAPPTIPTNETLFSPSETGGEMVQCWHGFQIRFLEEPSQWHLIGRIFSRQDQAGEDAHAVRH